MLNVHVEHASTNGTKLKPTSTGTKRVWMSDEAEAYIEVEIKEMNGDKATVETKDGRVS